MCTSDPRCAFDPGMFLLIEKLSLFLSAINIKTQVRQLPLVVMELKFLQAEDNSCRESKND